MPQCKSCRHWDHDGECNAANWGEDCPNPVVGIFVQVRVSDDSGLSVRVITDSEFGCTLHTPKSETK